MTRQERPRLTRRVETLGTESAFDVADAARALEAGDEVLVPDPGFPIYESVARLAGGEPVPYEVELDGAHGLQASAVAARISPRTRVLVLSSPHNPTGSEGISCATPAGAFYAFPNVTRVLHEAGFTTDGFAHHLLRSHGTATLAGTGFGVRGSGHIRLAFAAQSTTLSQALDRIGGCVRDCVRDGVSRPSRISSYS